MEENDKKLMSIDDLGDLLSNIFKYLTIPERFIASQVSRHWHKIDRDSLDDVKTLDTSDPSFWYIFGMHICKDKHLMVLRDIFNEYGARIKSLKYWNKKFSRFFPAVPLKMITQGCKNLEDVLLFEHVSPSNVTEFADAYQNLVGFGLRNLAVDTCSNEIGVLFRNNNNLRWLQIEIQETGGGCLKELRGKPIKELFITVGSRDVLDNLIMLLENLSTTITHLGINTTIETDWSDLMKLIGECKNLKVLIFRQKCFPEMFLSTLSRLDHLRVLDVSYSSAITDHFISDLASQLVRLNALNINGCSQITDQGLTALAKLPDLIELNVNSLNITGQGLLGHKKLRYLTCESCSIFDGFLSNVLTSCRDLELLNIKNCSNITLASLEIAIRVTAHREGVKMLTLILNSELAFHNKIKLPPLLELNCQKYSLLSQDDLKFIISGMNIGQQGFFIENSVIFANNAYSDDMKIPPLGDEFVRHILSHLSIPKRIKMSRVSKSWGLLIHELWPSVDTLDLTTTEWNYPLSTKSLEEIESIFDQTLPKFGKYVKHLKIYHVKGLETIDRHCPSLETISGNAATSSTLTTLLTANTRENLTKIQILTMKNNELSLGLIFQLNRNLKFVKLVGVEGINYSCLLDLNPNVIESLYLYNVHFLNDDQTIKDNFVNAFHRLVNLKCLEMSGTDGNLQVILDGIVGCKNLQNLSMRHKIEIDNSQTFEALLELENIRVLRLNGYQQMTDDFLDQLRLRAPSITHIDISGSRNVTDQGLRTIAHLSNLKTLIMEALLYVQGEGLSQLCGKNFQHLNCRSCVSLKSSAICDVLKNCPNLRFLNIGCCPRLDGIVIDTAFEVADGRSNGYTLKLITDLRLSQAKRGITPDSLELLMLEKLPTDEV